MTKLSVCIPSYNRHQYLEPLLDSILGQDYPELEIIICEDNSPERKLIREIVKNKIHSINDKNKIKYYENEENLGYDRNLRNLISKASGDYCLFMGNDDILVNGAIERILKVIEKYPNIAVISRAYQVFNEYPSNIKETIRHISEDKLFNPGIDAIRFFFRRVGVLSGLVFKRKPAEELETDIFDGHLYYQMYLAGMLLKEYCGYYISEVQTLSRDGINPDFGNSETEKNKFKPGAYTYESRVYMVEGLLKIARFIDDTQGGEIYKVIKKDIANYFYPYIRDQLNLPYSIYKSMILEFKNLGMNNEPLFHVHCILGFCLKRNGYDFVIKLIRKILGHSPRLGFK
jgi:glycosyltransferase involved in cell wall biosynthesis